MDKQRPQKPTELTSDSSCTLEVCVSAALAPENNRPQAQLTTELPSLHVDESCVLMYAHEEQLVPGFGGTNPPNSSFGGGGLPHCPSCSATPCS